MIPRRGESLAWPKDRFFWAAIPGQAAMRAGVAPPGVLLEVQDEFPVEIEALHVVVASAKDQHVIVCAARRSELAELESDAVSLSPESIPDGLPTPVALGELNLLVGDFLPRAKRRQRLRRHARAMLAVLGIFLLLSVGFERRALAWDRLAREQVTLAKRIEQNALDADWGSSRSLHQDVERLESIHDAIASNRKVTVTDPVSTLAALCSAWPTELDAKPQGFTVSTEAASVAVVVTGDARSFLESWHPPQGWRADEPRLGSTGELTRITLTLRPEQPRSQP